MKHTLTLVIGALLLSCQVFAGPTIQRSFMGCTLGETSRADFIIAMISAGAKMEDSNGAELRFAGDFNFEGYNMPICVAGFYDDTLMTIIVLDTLKQEHPAVLAQWQDNIKRKYSAIPKDASEDLIVSMALDTLKRTLATLDYEQWSKADDRTALVLIESESGILGYLIDSERIWKAVMQAFVDGLSNLGPDYDEANRVDGVAGLKFGTSKSEVRSQLTSKYGTPGSVKEHEIEYYGISIGGNEYAAATFYFATNPKSARSELVAVYLQKSYYEWKDEEARSFFNAVAGQYGRKYTNENKKTDLPNEKSYTYGMVDDEGYYPIIVSLRKSLSNGGDMRWYITVSYYMYKAISLYDDEI